MHDEGLNLYLVEAIKHAKNYQAELDELRDDLLNKNFRSRDYRAAERLLQIYTELCIGLSKHWVKSLNRETVSQAYQAFMLLKEQEQISADDLNTWRKIIGMRNGLVHDYLKIDLSVVENIIANKQYDHLADFCFKAVEVLKQEKGPEKGRS
jgi:uncharacterized protein YutE (UPF0331/DUF86 family)